MSVPPDVHSTKRDDSAIDYSVSGLSVPLQFVINNEPHLPRNREQKKLEGFTGQPLIPPKRPSQKIRFSLVIYYSKH
jgi:hypothetical protein